VAIVAERVPKLVAGDKLTREEFLRRWEVMPNLKRAELIGGIVYMPSPLSYDHGDTDAYVATWLGVYAANTPGCRAGSNATWLMLGDAPQPDVALRILPEYGGQSRLQQRFNSGAPELVAEICLSRSSYDLNQKYELYQEARVKEYLAVLIEEQEVRWHRLIRGTYRRMRLPEDGVFRSVVFPGLWLSAPALLEGDMAKVLATLQQGLDSAEHQAFVSRLAQKKRR
jgi:hypothetical protein